MARVLRLVFKADNIKVFDESAKKADKLGNSLEKLSNTPVLNFVNIAKNIDQNLKSIQGNVSKTVKSVASQTSGALQDTTDNIAREASKSFETTLSRLGLGIATVAAAEFSGLTRFLQSAKQEATTIFSFFSNITQSAFTNALPLAENFFNFVTDKFSSIQGAILGLSNIVGGLTTKISNIAAFLPGVGGIFGALAKDFGLIAGGVTTILAGATTIFGINVALKETFLLFRRFLGNGLRAVTPLERISSIIFTIDEGIRSIGLTGGTILKTVGLLGVAIVGSISSPLAGIIGSLGFINSFISGFQAFFLKGSLKTLAFFGSAKAQLGLILFNLKQIADKALPEIERKADSLKALGNKAEDADRVIKKVGKNLNAVQQAQAIKRTRFPLTAQFQQFSLEIKTFLTQLVREINSVFQVLVKGFGLTDKNLDQIQAKSKKASDSAAKSVTLQSSALDKIFSQGTKNLNIVDRSFRRFTQFFTGNPLAKALKEAGTEAGGLEKRFLSIRKVLSLITVPFRAIRGFLRSGFNVGKKGQGTRGTKDSASLKSQEIQLSKLKQANREIQKTVGSITQATKKLGQEASQAFKIKEIQNFNKNLKDSGAATAVLTKEVKTVSAVAKEATKGIGVEIEKILKEVFDLTTITRKLDKGSLFSRQANLSIQRLVQDVGLLAGGFQRLSSLQSNIKGVVSLVSTLSNSKFGRDISLEKFFKFAESPGFINAPKNFDNFRKKFEELANKLGVTAKDFPELAAKTAGAFVKELNKGLRSGNSTKTLEESLLILLEIFKELFPQSPAKRGPLAKLPKMGREIPKQLGDGMKKGKGEAAKGAEAIAKQISGYFPQSPALFGPLKFLIKAGIQIPTQLAQGMKKGLSLAASTAATIGKTIFENISRAADLQIFSDRFGVSVEVLSSFNLALADVGATTSDFQFALTSLNRVLGKTLTAEEGKKFKDLGIDIESARKANEPTVALFLQLSDALKGLPPQSKKFNDALQTLGITANSSIVNVLLKGSNELKEFQNQALKTGTITNSTLGKLSKEFVALVNRFNVIKETVLNGFLEELLPKIQETSEEFLNLFEKNRKQLEILLRAAGFAFGKIVEFVGNFVQIIITEPKKGFEILSKNFLSFGNFATTIFNVIFQEVGNKFKDFFSFLSSAALVGVKQISSSILKGLGNLALDLLIGLGTLVTNIFKGITTFFIEGSSKFVQFLKDIAFQWAAGIAIGFSDGVKKLPFGETIGKKLGVVLTEEDVASLGKRIEKIEERSFSLLDTTQKVSKGVENAFGSIVEGLKVDTQDLEKQSEKLFGSLFSEKSKKELEKSFSSLTTTLLGSFKEVSEFKITNTDLSKSVEELGELFQEKVGSAIESVFGEEQKSKVQGFFDSVAESAQELLSPVVSIFDSISEKIDEITENAKEKIRGVSQEQKKETEKGNKGDLKDNKDVIDKKLQQLSTGASAAVQIGENLVKLQGKQSKELFFINKGLAIVQAIINTAQGVTKAIGEGGVLGIATGALVAAAGASQIAVIASQQPPKFAKGGLVQGEGGIDNIHAMLTRNEFVIPAERVSQYGRGFFEGIRKGIVPVDVVKNLATNFPTRGANPTSLNFQNGGPVPPVNIKGQEQQPIILKMTVVNVQSQEETLRAINTEDGKNTLVNVMGKDKKEFQITLSDQQ